MIGCSAPFCNNSTVKGYILKIFPKNPERRAQWVANMNVKNWTPTDRSYLCEVHFSPNMWERRCDNKPKLKPNAVPTIFGYWLKEKTAFRQTEDAEVFSIKAQNEQCSVESTICDEEPSTIDKEQQSVNCDKGQNTTDEEQQSINCDEGQSITNEEQQSIHCDEGQSTTDEEQQSINCDEGQSTSDKEQQLTNSTKTNENIDQEHQTAATLKNENEKLKKILDTQTKRLFRLQRQSKALKMRVRRMKYMLDENKYKKALKMMLNEDQIKALCNKRRSVHNWSTETIQRALQMKFTCGTSGYEELLRQNIPFPSLRTLRRKLEGFKFESGISKEMIDFLKFKASNFEHDIDKECGLVVDEMSITQGHVFDPSTNTILGDITFPHKQGKATHALVLMLTGTACRWKHVVGYYFTGNSFNSETLKEIFFQIIHMYEAIGLHVNYITSDMGSGNVGIWKSCGLSTGRYSNEVTSCIVHPCDPTRFLYFLADVPHLLKNLKQSLLNNKFFIISEEFVIKYNLPSNKVQIEHFDELIKLQEDLQFLITPKLNKTDVNNNNNFSKMRVDKAKHIFSTDVSSSLEFLADENQKPEYITTSWFVKNISHWFSLMTSRSCKLALGKKYEEVYHAKISFLREMIDLFATIKIGKNATFKPVQRGAIISTTSVINLVNYLLNNRGFQFVFTGRFTQDCLENLFSQLRQKNVIPNCLQFKNDLKIIAMTIYFKSISKGNYDQDDSNFFSGFLNYLPKITKKDKMIESQSTSAAPILDRIPPFDSSNIIIYNNIEMNSLYNIAGYCLNTAQRLTITCSKCIQSAGSKVPVRFQFSKLVRLRCHSVNTLYFVNKETFWVFLKLENIFRHYYRYFSKMRGVNLIQFLFEKFCEIPADHILNCHTLRQKLFKRFAAIRLKLKQKHRVSSLKCYDSKSMAMHYSFK